MSCLLYTSELAKMISVNIPTDTRLISISVNAKTGQDAQTLANKVREVASEKIKNMTKVEDVTTLEEAKLPESPSSPNIKRNVLLGAVLGGFLACLLYTSKNSWNTYRTKRYTNFFCSC